MTTLLLFTLLAGAPSPDASPRRAALIKKLQDDIYKVDRAIDQTELLVARSAGAPYLPELRFRLCELVVEKSRYLYHLQAEQRPEGVRGAMVSPETKLLKEKAVGMYARLLREFPDFKDNDKVRFFLAHEHRELGQFDKMLATLEELTEKHPRSPLRLEAEQIMGDLSFDRADLEVAEKHYKNVLAAPESPVHDLARYKMGWVRVNQSKHAEAVTFFEAAVTSRPPPGVDPGKSLNIKREALLDLVYSYTEAKPAKNALAYFERLADSRTTYALALEKLATRYAVKQQPENAIPVLRRLLEARPDAELDLERATALYDHLKTAKQNKKRLVPTPGDVHFLVRAGARVRVDGRKDAGTRRRELAEVEEMARDLATQLHLMAQEKSENRLYVAAAEAYAEYLALFRKPQHAATLMRNRADALYAAQRYTEAARQFEELARYVDGTDKKGHESAVYGALLAHKSSVSDDELDKRTPFERVDAREALKRLGATYAKRYPQAEHVAEIRFNIARAHFDDGELRQAAEAFTAFALAYPTHKDAPAAGHLALDAHRQLRDFKGLDATGRKLVASRLPESFRQDAKRVLAEVKGEELQELALRSAEETGDVVSGLLKVAEENPNADVGAKALQGALLASREKGDYAQERELARKLLIQFPNTPQAAEVPLAMARRAAETARFREAADWFERAAPALRGSASAEAFRSAGNLWLALGEVERGMKNLEASGRLLPPPRRAELLADAAETVMKLGDTSRAVQLADAALKADAKNATAAAVVAQLQPQRLRELLPVLAQSEGEPAARGLWHATERSFAAYRSIPEVDIEKKAGALQDLEQAYARIAGMGSREWAVASLWRLGLAYQELARSVEEMPAPKELSGADVEEFRQAVKERAVPLAARAKEAFGACLTKASSLEVYTPAVVGCRTAKAEVEPLAAATRLQATGAAPPELQRQVDAAPDARSLHQLGLAYLAQKQLALARLALARAVDLDENMSAAHGALGWTLFQLGDPLGAAAAYRKALETDPANDRARANLAALKCRVGDTEGSKGELSLIKDHAPLSGGDVDPQWRSCLNAVSSR